MGGNAFGVAPQPDPRPAIISFKDQLAERGIELLVVPTPVKPTIHPEMLSPGMEAVKEPLRNQSFDSMVSDLEEAGVHIYDPADLLKRLSDEAPQFLATDTHWTPTAMEAVAKSLADKVGPLLEVEGEKTSWEIHQESHTQFGDIATMLDMPDWQQSIDEETVATNKVLDSKGGNWKPAKNAQLLLLGDSFTNIYSLPGMGWGESAGFAEQLSYRLGLPINRLSRNDAGAHASRHLLQQALVKDPHFLDGTKVVVWQFAERELAVGDWKDYTLPSAPAELAPPPPTPSSTTAVADPASAPAAFASLADSADGQAAIVGKDDWIFLTSELRHLASPPDSSAGDEASPVFAAIVDLKDKLAELGIELVLMPAPPRAAIYPDKLFSETPRQDNGLPERLDVGLQDFYESLRGEGVEVIDLTDRFIEARIDETESGLPVLEQDSHWSPRGISIAAEAVSEFLEEREWYADADFTDVVVAEPEALNYVGDLVSRVDGHPETTSTTEIEKVAVGGQPVEFDPSSPVLLLSDSHGLVFSTGGDMHAEGAGLGEALAAELGIVPDVMARRGSGADVRKDLARRFLNAPADAQAKKLVIYSFAARTLTEAQDWRKVPLQR